MIRQLGRIDPLFNVLNKAARPRVLTTRLHFNQTKRFASTTANQEKPEGENVDIKKPKEKVTFSTLKRIIMLSRPELKLMMIGLVGLFISTASTLLTPIGVGQLVDSLNLPPEESMQALKQTAIYLAGVFVVGGVAVIARVSAVQIAGMRVARRTRQQLFNSLVRQDTAFFDQNKTGELINRLSNDVTVVSDTLTSAIVSGTRSLLEAIGGVCFLMFLSSKLTVTALSVFPALGVGAVLYGRYVRKLYKQHVDSLAASNAFAQEKISSMRIVRQFAKEEQEMTGYGKKIQDNYEIGVKVGIMRAAFYSGVFTATNFAVLAVLYTGGMYVAAGAITVGNLTSFLMYSIYVGASFTNLSTIYGDLMKAAGSSERIFELIDSKPSIPLTGGIKLDNIIGRIEFNNVDFAYPTRKEVLILNNFNLVVEPGTVVAVVGGSGTGKSTLISLIDRFYDIDGGSITIDGHDIKTLDPTWLRDKIGVVSQEPSLFDQTIMDNIRYGSGVDCTEEEVIQASRKANAHQFIVDLPDGYQTLVGERGITLSGGQKQRVAIARTILKDPKLLILDEATSSLDANSEHLVQEALDVLMKDKTVIVIAHRLSTIKRADVVAVMHEGKIAEIGSHETLRKNENGLYSKLVNRQLMDVLK
ncbi:ATP-binding cassette, subfamily B [Acrasis kona]|uniref:ATP-binding cassette, subfamily B n=1 Tax=Acrasis kona TaxID=1008807 RepID=A0AAW2YJ64_9EUKA